MGVQRVHHHPSHLLRRALRHVPQIVESLRHVGLLGALHDRHAPLCDAPDLEEAHNGLPGGPLGDQVVGRRPRDGVGRIRVLGSSLQQVRRQRLDDLLLDRALPLPPRRRRAPPHALDARGAERGRGPGSEGPHLCADRGRAAVHMVQHEPGARPQELLLSRGARRRHGAGHGPGALRVRQGIPPAARGLVVPGLAGQAGVRGTGLMGKDGLLRRVSVRPLPWPRRSVHGVVVQLP
mmetsp:Transcript_132439/g.382849  ORF Transcript_132439/g.382849 Transcript_132439/m.382849 type:complete len:236 (+) Transcript_132439:2212-2919(+)